MHVKNDVMNFDCNHLPAYIGLLIQLYRIHVQMVLSRIAILLALCNSDCVTCYGPKNHTSVLQNIPSSSSVDCPGIHSAIALAVKDIIAYGLLLPGYRLHYDVFSSVSISTSLCGTYS